MLFLGYRNNYTYGTKVELGTLCKISTEEQFSQGRQHDLMVRLTSPPLGCIEAPHDPCYRRQKKPTLQRRKLIK